MGLLCTFLQPNRVKITPQANVDTLYNINTQVPRNYKCRLQRKILTDKVRLCENILTDQKEVDMSVKYQK